MWLDALSLLPQELVFLLKPTHSNTQLIKYRRFVKGLYVPSRCTRSPWVSGKDAQEFSIPALCKAL